MPINQLKQRIDAASGNEKADLLIINAMVADVFNHEFVQMDLAIKDGEFISSTKREAHEILDAEGMYLIPSFIDSHVHIESSMVTPAEFAKVVVPHGVTTVIADPHEIANVAGAEGIRFMLEQSEDLLLDVKMMLPSCVPAASFEESGAVLLAEDLEPFADHPNVLGLAEVMDYPALLKGDRDMLQKLHMAESRAMPIDGHLAGLSKDLIDVYRAAGVRTDHEVTTAEEALSRVQRGMYVQIRQGSVAQNLPAVIQAVSSRNARRFILCTDDKHLDELEEEGSIDHLVRLCIKHGIEPLSAIQMASLNAAECFGLRKKGAIAPGYEADFILTDDLEALPIRRVFRKGTEAAAGGKISRGSIPEPIRAGESLTDSVHLGPFPESRLALAVQEDVEVPVIELIPNELVTKKRMEKTNVRSGEFVPCTERDHLKLAVIERHRASGKAGIGIVKGFKFTGGAIACTIAHDSHHIMAVGTNDAAIHSAVTRLQDLKGGMAVADETGRILADLPLTIGGLMSERPYEEVIADMKQIHQTFKAIGFNEPFNPFVMLSFLALPVIPELKLTVNGLFDVNALTYLSY